MSVTIDNMLYSLIDQPNWGSEQTISSKKTIFESEGGHFHQKNSFTNGKRVFTLQWSAMAESQKNLLEAWLDVKKSETFWYVDPVTLGSGNERAFICRVISSDIPCTPSFYDGTESRFVVSLQLREV